MSWEEQIMRSKTSFFNSGLAWNLLKRSWPFWFCYLALLVLAFPVSLYNATHYWRDTGEALADYKALSIPQSGCTLAILSFFVCIIAVMIVFSYLYNARTCGLVCSLPLSRETVFCTVYLTGLLPLLAADAATALITRILFGRYTAEGLILKWLSLVVMGNVAFYGFAVFCAMLTGSLFILPLVYAVLNATAFVAESAMNYLFSVFIFGFAENAVMLRKLSPIVELASRLRMTDSSPENTKIGERVFQIEGYSTLAVYCAAGIVLSACALLMYRKRRMETAGDTVSIPFLKPLFKYCMAFGTALVLAAAVTTEFFSSALKGTKLAIIALILLLAGAFIGYFAAEMLIQKTMRVFGSKWKGLLAVWAVLLVFFAVSEGNLSGYETRLPEESQIEKAELIVYQNSALEEKENIAQLLDIHKSIIEQKKAIENTDGFNKIGVTIRYSLSNGKTMARHYSFYSFSQDGLEKGEDDSVISRLQTLYNSPEAILSRHEPKIEIIPEHIDYCEVSTIRKDEERNLIMSGETVRLSWDDAYDLYQNALLPDMQSGNLGRAFFNFAYTENLSDTSIFIQLKSTEKNYVNRVYDYMSFDVQLDSEMTIAWLAEHLGLEVQPYPAELNEQEE